jgi:predicted extracellular nuclease
MPQVGDELQLTGTVNEYYSFTQIIDVTTSTLVSSGNVTNPIQVDASDISAVCSESSESYESMLVSLSNLSFDSVDDFGNWVVSDASGPAMVDDYYFDGTFPTISAGDTYECVSGVLGYSYSEFKVYPRNISDFECQDIGCTADGDANGDGVTNILDIVQVVNFIMGNIEFSDEQICSVNMNGDAGLNILDIVQIVNIILQG